MTNKNLRLPDTQIDEAEALVPLVAQDPEVKLWGHATVSDVLRMAIHEGLPVLRKRYGKTDAAVKAA